MAQITDKEGVLATAYSYDAFRNTSVRDYTGNITGNKKITENYTRNPYTYNGEYTDASTGNQYLRARYYSPETGNFFTEDSYLGRHVEKGSTEEKVIITAASFIAGVIVAKLTGGTATGVIGKLLGVEEGSEGAVLLAGTVNGTITGSTTAGVHSTLSGNDAQTVLKDTLIGGAAGGWLGGLSASLKLALSGGAVAAGTATGAAEAIKEPGVWEMTNESMSEASRNYQRFITGAEDGMVYKVNGVKFDGYKDGVLIEAKGNYSNFVNKKTGEFYKWFDGKDSLISQAKRQSDAANGIKIQWYFNDEVSMSAIKELFSDQDVKGIDFILKPMK